MVNDLKHKGYVELIPDKTDARAKYVRLTIKGQKLINLAIIIVFEIETHYQSLLGEKNYNSLRQSASHIYQWHPNKKEK